MRRTRPILKTFFRPALLLLFLGATTLPAAQDSSIDRLLNKLPPPEKLVKQNNVDPASNDPLAGKMLAELRKNNYGKALSYSRDLTKRYPKSVGAQWIHGLLAYGMKRFPESSEAFRATLKLQPDFVPGHAGLASVAVAQEDFRSALTIYQKITKLDPKSEVGWLGSSHCAERLGRGEQSLSFAKRATSVAPTSYISWWQRARAEKLLGHGEAASKALAKSKQLQRAEEKKARAENRSERAQQREREVVKSQQR